MKRRFAYGWSVHFGFNYSLRLGVRDGAEGYVVTELFCVAPWGHTDRGRLRWWGIGWHTWKPL